MSPSFEERPHTLVHRAAMQIPPSAPPGDETCPLAVLAGDVFATYIQWRVNEPRLIDAYERWSSASPSDKSGRLAAYTAELDQAQATARTYANAILELELWLARR